MVDTSTSTIGTKLVKSLLVSDPPFVGERSVTENELLKIAPVRGKCWITHA